MNKIIWYKLDNINELNLILTSFNDLKILTINNQNINQYELVIRKCIELFNSEIKWDQMWNLQNSFDRLNNDQILYVLISDEDPIGFVWLDETYLYNTFVSKKREDGMSHWFLQNVIIDRFNNNVEFIELYTEEWNTRSIRFWEKLGFKKL